MMGLAKMAPDGWAYYAREVAAGGEDYFLGHGEEPGRWIGRGAEGLGLSGGVDEEHLARLFGQGCHPATGAPLGRAIPPDSKAVTGFALSFSPPKSVSILWALGADDGIASRVRDGHDAAVAAAMEYLQDHACFTRRGHGGTVQEAARGYLGAAFTHRTSRAGDPQLHTHILVANRVQSASDGRWLSLDGRELFEAQKAAGMLYKAALRAELAARLGVSWGEVDANGGAEIMGVPDGLVEHFSKRRAQVEAAAARLIGERETSLGRSLTGDERAAAYQLATYQSRAAKGEGGDTTEGLRERWRAEADAAGMAPQRWASRVFEKQTLTRREAALRRLGTAESLDLVITETIERLERTHATWGRSQLVEALTVALPAHRMTTAGRVRHSVESVADTVLARPDVIRLTCPERPDVRHGALRYSTWWTLQTEQGVLDTVEEGRAAGIAVVSDALAEAAVTSAGLGSDQAHAVERLCGGGERVAVLVGPAGSGKSRTLGAARQAWDSAGNRVRGVAPSAVAAGVLAEQAGIPSETLAKFLREQDRGRDRVSRGEVIVCDEASMVATRDLATLILHAHQADAKVVLVGDHHQLGSIDAGGLFRLLATDATTAELTTVRRFTNPWEADASRRLRAGDPAVIDDYANRGRVRGGDRDQALDTAHHAWLDARGHGRSVMVMAADHDTVDQLAMRARAARVAAGEVQPEGITVGAQTVGLGDEVLTTRNDRRLVTTTGAWVRNGDRWRITKRASGDSLLLTSLDGRGTVTVPGAYVHENLALGYAATVHKAQGVTVDHGVLVVDPSTTAEHLYVGMTRGRHHNQACVITEPGGDEHVAGPPATAHGVLTAALRRSSNEPSATEVIRAEVAAGQPSGPSAAIADGLRQAQLHSLEETVRRQPRLRVGSRAADAQAPGALIDGPEL